MLPSVSFPMPNPWAGAGTRDDVQAEVGQLLPSQCYDKSIVTISLLHIAIGSQNMAACVTVATGRPSLPHWVGESDS